MRHAKYTRIYLKSIEGLLAPLQRDVLENEILENPKLYPVIKGTGGIRKARFASHNKGKSGGSRLCYFYFEIKETVYFLKAYAKNQQTDLSNDDKKLLSQMVRTIKELNYD